MTKMTLQVVCRREIPIEVDSGFQGLQKQYDNLHLPHKKPKGGELSNLQKTQNRQLSQSRVVCENAFAGVKRYNAVSVIYRNRIENFDDHLMLTAAFLMELLLDGCLRESQLQDQHCLTYLLFPDNSIKLNEMVLCPTTNRSLPSNCLGSTRLGKSDIATKPMASDRMKAELPYSESP